MYNIIVIGITLNSQLQVNIVYFVPSNDLNIGLNVCK